MCRYRPVTSSLPFWPQRDPTLPIVHQRYSPFINVTDRYLNVTHRSSTLLNVTQRYSTLPNVTQRYPSLPNITQSYLPLPTVTHRYSTWPERGLNVASTLPTVTQRGLNVNVYSVDKNNERLFCFLLFSILCIEFIPRRFTTLKRHLLNDN